MAKKDEDILNEKEGKLKALQAAMSKIEKDFGKGSIMKLGDEQIEKVEVILLEVLPLMPHWVWVVILRDVS